MHHWRHLASRSCLGIASSRPDCRAPTSGPQGDPAKSVNVGVAAHITAASPGGPRYDPTFLTEKRGGPENGIWLCQTCAKLIDNDPARFTVEVLKKPLGSTSTNKAALCETVVRAKTCTGGSNPPLSAIVKSNLCYRLRPPFQSGSLASRVSSLSQFIPMQVQRSAKPLQPL